MNPTKAVKLNANLKKEYVMKVSRMTLTPLKLKAIRAYFTVTIGAIRMREFKLIKSSNSGKWHIAFPDEEFTNKNGKSARALIVEITDPKINDAILELALAEYEVQKEIANANAIACEAP